jgi:hypothetical protein
MKISDSLRGQTFWNNTARISTELFQTYFNMTVSVAGEMIYLETKLDEIKDLQRKKDKASGVDVKKAARARKEAERKKE